MKLNERKKKKCSFDKLNKQYTKGIRFTIEFWHQVV